MITESLTRVIGMRAYTAKVIICEIERNIIQLVKLVGMEENMTTNIQIVIIWAITAISSHRQLQLNGKPNAIWHKL